MFGVSLYVVLIKIDPDLLSGVSGKGVYKSHGKTFGCPRVLWTSLKLFDFRLVAEVKELHKTLSHLSEQLARSEEALTKLNVERKELEAEIMMKNHSANIDATRCITTRPKLPPALDLAGY